MNSLRFLVALCFCISCGNESKTDSSVRAHEKEAAQIVHTSLIVLGNVQDAGSPHIGCKKECCKELFENAAADRKVTSVGLIDPDNKKTYLFEATPDISEQLKILKNKSPFNANEIPNGIFITHAHIGHYTGLMYLGKEATNAKNAAVYAMPKLKAFLETNGPWGQLVSNKNIALEEIHNNEEISLSPNIKVIPIRVPHRDEYSETVGFTIIGPNKSVLFIPDIDKWQKWNTSVVEAVMNVDYALIDATFYDGVEINNRDISEIPHPFVIETMALFKNQSKAIRNKIHFIHLNHTNPLLNPDSEATNEVLSKGFHIARINDIITL
ncbi:MAG: MBL fold metallo-hydrolase [Maribacter sp.]|nr:MBL fold metallo-hydrolase [Maribacter sp.]